MELSAGESNAVMEKYKRDAGDGTTSYSCSCTTSNRTINRVYERNTEHSVSLYFREIISDSVV